MKKISSEIALSQVELENKIEKVKKILENIFLLYTKLCDPTLTRNKPEDIESGKEPQN